MKRSCADPRLILLLALLCALLAPRMGRGAGTPAPAPDPVAEKQRQLQALKTEIEANRKEIDRLKSKEHDLGKVKEHIRRDHELTLRYLKELEEQDATLRSDLADRQVDLLDHQSAAHDAAQRLKKEVVHYYKLRQVAGAELLFSSRSFGELFARSQFLARLVYRERVELAALADERALIDQAAGALELRRQGVEQLQQEKRREEMRLAQQGQVAQNQLEAVKDTREEKEKNLRQLEASQSAIRRMITRLEEGRAREVQRGTPPPMAGSLESLRGRLAWPVKGTVIAGFGFEVHPKYGTQVPRNGIDIAAAQGTPIVAVAPGVVEFVDWLPGYGQTVILSHGSGYYTLYAHASSTSVKRGDRVGAGQELARVGDTDSLNGPCLHFEIRSGEKALDPQGWLR